MKRTITLFALIFGLGLATIPAIAHHSFAAEYDSNQPATLHGVVTKVEWMNPHARFYVDVKDAAGRSSIGNSNLVAPTV